MRNTQPSSPEILKSDLAVEVFKAFGEKTTDIFKQATQVKQAVDMTEIMIQQLFNNLHTSNINVYDIISACKIDVKPLLNTTSLQSKEKKITETIVTSYLWRRVANTAAFDNRDFGIATTFYTIKLNQSISYMINLKINTNEEYFTTMINRVLAFETVNYCQYGIVQHLLIPEQVEAILKMASNDNQKDNVKVVEL